MLVVWPARERKRVISDHFKHTHALPHAIDAGECVSFPFDRALAYQAQAWITRKCTYTMGATAVCDREGRFTYFATRYVGSMHDSLAFKMCGHN